MKTARSLVIALVGVVLAFGEATDAAAQGGPPAGRQGGGQRVNAARGGDGQRIQQERRLQERIDQVVRQRLELTDEQFAKIKEVASRIEDDRRALRNEETTARFGMRQELLAGSKADENRVAAFLDKLPRFERRRVDLMEQEQKELSKFLTPSQRARYIGLQEELRRTMQEVQRRRMEKTDAPGAAIPPDRRPPDQP